MNLIDLDSDTDYMLDGKYAVRAGADREVGKTCYKIYLRYPNYRGTGKVYDYFCDTVRCLKEWLKNDPDYLYIRERPFTKSDRIHLGKLVFWTREEAERAIKRKEQENE